MCAYVCVPKIMIHCEVQAHLNQGLRQMQVFCTAQHPSHILTLFVFLGFFFVCLFFETGFLCVAWLSWNSLCRPGWPRIQKSACLCLPSAWIKGVCHHTRLINVLTLKSQQTQIYRKNGWYQKVKDTLNIPPALRKLCQWL